MSHHSATAQWKSSFQHCDVELNQSYRVVLESLESIKGDILFARVTSMSIFGLPIQNRPPWSSWMYLGYTTSMMTSLLEVKDDLTELVKKKQGNKTAKDCVL